VLALSVPVVHTGLGMLCRAHACVCVCMCGNPLP